MSDNQTVWKILWEHAAGVAGPSSAFEIDDVVPAVAAALNVPDGKAKHLTGALLIELGRMPEGRQYFAREGDAVVPLPEFTRSVAESRSSADAYPYEQ